MYDYLAKIILLGPSGSGKSAGSTFRTQVTTLITVQVLPTPPICEKRM